MLQVENFTRLRSSPSRFFYFLEILSNLNRKIENILVGLKMNQTEEFGTIGNLRPGLKGFNVKFKCISKNEEREVASKQTEENLRVNEALIGDESGAILLTLWNNDIDTVEVDHYYKLKNSYTTVFKGSLRLNKGRYGVLEEMTEADIPTVNEENNLSDKIYEEKRNFSSSYGRDRPYSKPYGNRRDSGPNYRSRY